MEPKGRIPPRQTMTAGSMNLREENIQCNDATMKGQHHISPLKQECIVLWQGKRNKVDTRGNFKHKSHFLLADGHSARWKVGNVYVRLVYCAAIFHSPKSLFRQANHSLLLSWCNSLLPTFTTNTNPPYTKIDYHRWLWVLLMSHNLEKIGLLDNAKKKKNQNLGIHWTFNTTHSTRQSRCIPGLSCSCD